MKNKVFVVVMSLVLGGTLFLSGCTKSEQQIAIQKRVEEVQQLNDAEVAEGKYIGPLGYKIGITASGVETRKEIKAANTDWYSDGLTDAQIEERLGIKLSR